MILTLGLLIMVGAYIIGYFNGQESGINLQREVRYSRGGVIDQAVKVAVADALESAANMLPENDPEGWLRAEAARRKAEGS